MDDVRAFPDDTGRIAEAEGQLLDDTVREAVALYTLLPAAARRSLRGLAVLGSADEQAALGRAIGRLIVRRGFDIARRRTTEAAERVYPEGTLTTEEEVVEEAIRLVREARTRTA